MASPSYHDGSCGLRLQPRAEPEVVCPPKTMPVSWIDLFYTNENIKKYNKITEEVCRENNIPILDIGPLNIEDFYDGLHPNAEGHRKIFEKVKDFLFEQKWM